MTEPTHILAPREASAFILGGNASTLAFLSSVVPENRQIAASLVSLAWTPIGVRIGEGHQRVNIAADNIGGWVDQTFPPDDDRSFVASLRDLEMLVRVGWHRPTPEALTESTVLNPEDLPDDLLDAIDQPAVTLLQCAVCRRICVRDHFVWNDRQLCAWDYHATVFGRRGPWRSDVYEERLFDTLPRAAYVAPGLLEEVGVDAIAAVSRLSEATMRAIVNAAIGDDGAASYLAVRTDDGLTLLRERRGTES